MKKLKKLMAALLVALMALAVVPAGAFAAESTAKGEFTPSVWKVVPANDNVTLPQTFEFTITLDDSAQVGSYTPSTFNGETKSVTVNSNEPTKVEFAGITLGAGIYRFKIEETANPVFTTDLANGIYAYVIVDNTGNVSTVYYSTEKVDLSNDGNVTVPTTPATGEDAAKLEKATFTNTVNEGYNFTVTKQVAGTASNPDDEFTFTVSATLPQGTSADVLLNGKKVGTLTGDNSTVTVSGVKAGMTISTTALPENTDVTVTESSENNNYTSQSWTLNGDPINNTSRTQSIEIDSTTQAYVITNTKDAATITGFVMHYAPYIALIAFAGVAVTLVAKRRNHSEF